MNDDTAACLPRMPWNKGKITGPKPPLRPGHVWALRAQKLRLWLQLLSAKAPIADRV
jgi:hypothetical protein